jgi:hypothetical protein
MALKHGNKIYLQLLLDPNRAKLAADLASCEGIKTTAWIRNAVYNELQRQLPTSVYKEAQAQDEAVWRRSVRRRIEGRSDSTTFNNNDIY